MKKSTIKTVFNGQKVTAKYHETISGIDIYKDDEKYYVKNPGGDGFVFGNQDLLRVEEYAVVEGSLEAVRELEELMDWVNSYGSVEYFND